MNLSQKVVYVCVHALMCVRVPLLISGSDTDLTFTVIDQSEG